MVSDNYSVASKAEPVKKLKCSLRTHLLRLNTYKD